MNPPAPLQMSSYTGSCCGGRFTFFKDKEYANDLANNRREAGLFQAWADNQISAANLKAMLQPAPVQQARPSVLQNMVQRVIQMLPQPVQNFINQMIQTIQTPVTIVKEFITKTADKLENMASKVISFFFGNKKDKAREKELRDQDDTREANLFDDFFVKDPLKTNNDGSNPG